MAGIDLEDPYTREQLDNIIEFENTMLKKCGLDGIKALASMACEVSQYEGLVATYKGVDIASKIVVIAKSVGSIAQNVVKLQDETNLSKKAEIRGWIMSDMFKICDKLLSFSEYTKEFEASSVCVKHICLPHGI